MKQVIVVDESLRLPRGKLAAQVAHASVAALIEADEADVVGRWLEEGMPKVVVRCEGESELRTLERRAREARLPVALIRDAGRTVLEPGTATCLGIGPAADDEVDAVTGELRLV